MFNKLSGKKVILLMGITILIASEIVFRLLFAPVNQFQYIFDAKNGIYKYNPLTQGRVMCRNVKNGYFRINKAGWNSKNEYQKDKNGLLKIAFIGASGVKATEVNVNLNVGSIIEKELAGRGIKNEVYSFGLGDMTIPHAMFLSKYVIREYSPDMIIIYAGLGDVSHAYKKFPEFFGYQVVNDTIHEVPPTYHGDDIFTRGKQLLDHSRILNILIGQYDIGRRIRRQFNNNQNPHENYVSTALDRKNDSIIFDYSFNQFALIQKEVSQLIFVFGPAECGTYNEKIVKKGPSRFLETIKTMLAKKGLKYCDVTKAFVEDYQNTGIKVDFLYNSHFNEYGNALLGKTIANQLYLYFNRPVSLCTD